MSFSIKFHPEVKEDVRSAREWYSSVNDDLSADFLNRIKSETVLIAAQPRSFSKTISRDQIKKIT
jgi:hypothetical protein